MKNKILKLRKSGKSYNEICKELNCSKSLVSYYCGKGQRNKTLSRQKSRRLENPLIRRVENFQIDRKLKDKTEDFQRERFQNKNKNRLGKRNITFRWQDVIEKFGVETSCYLTGRKINFSETKTYHFDHIIPVSNGGSSKIDNLGILCKRANEMKGSMSISETLEMCKEILEFNGYMVEKRK